MLVKLHTQGFESSDALNDYTDEKVRLALGLYRDRIRVVDVFLADINGPKGGEDMRCKIRVRSDGLPDTLAQEAAENIYDAVSICSHRIKRAVGRRFDRNLEIRRRRINQKHFLHDEYNPERHSDLNIPKHE